MKRKILGIKIGKRQENWYYSRNLLFVFNVTKWKLGYFFIRPFGVICSLALSKLRDGVLLYSLMMSIKPLWAKIRCLSGNITKMPKRMGSNDKLAIMLSFSM